MNKKFAIVLALALIAIVCCAGCIDPQEPVDPVDPVVPVDPVDPVTPPVDPVVPAEEYSVFFMMNYGDAGAYTAETVKAGDAVSKPANPSRSGYNFKGWFTAAEGGAAYDFTQAVNSDLTLYAQWSKKSSSGGSSTPSHTHSYTAVVTEPTCTTEGYTTYTCSCGHSYTGNTVPMLGHSQFITKANESETGAVDTICGVCNAVLFTTSATGVLEIYTVDDLKNFAATVNAGETYSGKTVKLMANLDLNNEEWTPIGTAENNFTGTFEGTNKVISNLKITGSEYVGLFGYIDGYVKNLSVKHAVISGNHWVGTIVGYGLGGEISGCSVSDATITVEPNGVSGNYDNGDKAGGIVGYGGYGDGSSIGHLKVTDCTVSNVKITAYRDVGGIVGAAWVDGVTGNRASDVTVTVDKVKNSYNDAGVNGNPILGRAFGTGTLEDQTATNWKVIVIYADGFWKVTDATSSVYEISSVDGLKYFRDTVNAGETYSGKTVKLTDDIDLKNEEWEPIGTYAYHKEINGGKTKDVVDTDYRFKGTFDGQDHTISNLNIVMSCDLRTEDEETEMVSGFFSVLGGTVKNVIFDGASVESENSNAVGVVVGKLMYAGGPITEVTVKNAVVSGKYCVGAVAGSINGEITNVDVESVYVSGNHYVGGVVGYVYGKVTDSTVINSEIIAVPNKLGEAYDNGDKVGGIVGYLAAEPTSSLESCSVSNTIVTGYRDVGGIAGMVNTGDGDTAHASVKNNNADTVRITAVQTGDTAYGYKTPNAGKIVGRIDSADVNKITLDSNIDSDCIVVVKLNTLTSDNLKDSLADATPGSTVNVPAGTYTFPNNVAEGVTIVCEEGTVFEGTSSPNINGATVIGATFKNENAIAVSGTVHGTFKECVFEGSEALRWCYSVDGDEAVFENCVIKTDFRGVHFDGMNGDVTFKNCEINGFNAFGGSGTVTFEECTFGYDESSYNGLNMYVDTVLIDCTFNFVSSGKTNFIDFEATGCTLTINNCVAKLDEVNSDISNFIGGTYVDDTTVIIDGVTQ